jgi:hypothetical protein
MRDLDIGDRVESGVGEDHDTGRIVAWLPAGVTGKCYVLVAWDSGTRTRAVLADLRRIGR